MTLSPLRLLSAALWLAFLTACNRSSPTPPPAPDDKKVQSVADLEPPKDAGPPVNSVSYEDGYEQGSKAGETAARALPPRSKTPGEDEINVLALEAAGTDTARGPRWQRGYASGYLDGFERISLGRK
jgi:hypothetical protein